jgi:chromosome segregation ATPase
MIQGEDESALVPLLNKVAQSIAKGLVVAMKELEDHIAMETRKVGDAVDRRLDDLQNSLHEISRFVADQHSTNSAVEGRLQELQGSLHETAGRYAVDLDALRSETRASSQASNERIDGLCRDLGVQREEIAALSGALSALSSRVDAMVERLDRQADAVRSLCATYSQRGSELEHLVEGLARLRASSTHIPTEGL